MPFVGSFVAVVYYECIYRRILGGDDEEEEEDEE